MSGVRVPPPLLTTDDDTSCQSPPPQGTYDNDGSAERDPASCQDEPLCAPSSPQGATHGATRPRIEDPDLILIMERWPDLPPAVRAGIVAMVRAAELDGS